MSEDGWTFFNKGVGSALERKLDAEKNSISLSDKLQIQMKRDAVLSRRKKSNKNKWQERRRQKQSMQKRFGNKQMPVTIKIASAKEEMMKNKKRAED